MTLQPSWRLACFGVAGGCAFFSRVPDGNPRTDSAGAPTGATCFDDRWDCAAPGTAIGAWLDGCVLGEEPPVCEVRGRPESFCSQVAVSAYDLPAPEDCGDLGGWLGWSSDPTGPASAPPWSVERCDLDSGWWAWRLRWTELARASPGDVACPDLEWSFEAWFRHDGSLQGVERRLLVPCYALAPPDDVCCGVTRWDGDLRWGDAPADVVGCAALESSGAG